MRLEAYTVHDVAVGAFMTPFFVRSRGEAIRSFQDAVGNPEHQFHRHSSDYVLYFCGAFSDENGLFTPVDVPDRVCSAADFKTAV